MAYPQTCSQRRKGIPADIREADKLAHACRRGALQAARRFRPGLSQPHHMIVAASWTAEFGRRASGESLAHARPFFPGCGAMGLGRGGINGSSGEGAVNLGTVIATE